MYLEATSSSSRRRAIKFQKRDPGAKYSTLPLPFEIRDQILTLLLVSDQEALELVTSTRLARGSFYSHKPERGTGPLHLSDLRVAKQFCALAQVSRKLRTDAINVLFYRNKWLLTISLSGQEHTLGRLSVITWDTPAMIRKFWGLDALLSMRYIRLNIQNELVHSRKRLQVYLDVFVKALRMSPNLRRLEVEWINHETLGPESPPKESPWYLPPAAVLMTTRHMRKAQIQDLARRADGTRPSTKHFRGGISRWEEGQTMLKPLGELRGIPEAVVMGCVTDKWAEHLEKCMKMDKMAMSMSTTKGTIDEAALPAERLCS